MAQPSTDPASPSARTADPTPLVLELRDVTHSYGRTLALDRVSIDVRRGEFLTLLGPSGSGKSTLLRVIAGLESPDSVAAMRLDGADIADTPANKRNVATVFQHFALFPHMTVGENVEYGLKLRRVPPAERRAQAEAALALVRLPDKFDRRIHQLSGGERQRVALARALVTRPQILLLDEPLGALDERLRLDMQIELVELRRKTGGTFILVTHSQEEAITMSDRIILMRAGRIEQIGAPQALFESPATLFAARFMGVENVIRGTLGESRDGCAVLRVGTTEIVGRPVGGVEGAAPGTPAFAALRAEHVRLATKPEAAPAATGTLQGRVSTIVYKGKYRDVTAETALGPITARLWDSEAEVAADTSTALTWAQRHCVVGLLDQDDAA